MRALTSGWLATRGDAGGPEGMVMGGGGGTTADSFLLPLIIGISLVSFLLSVTVASAPTEDEIRFDAALRAYEQRQFAPDLTPATSRRPDTGPAAGDALTGQGSVSPPASISPGPGTPSQLR